MESHPYILLAVVAMLAFLFRDKLKKFFQRGQPPAGPAASGVPAPLPDPAPFQTNDARALVQGVHEALAKVRADEQATANQLATVKANAEARLATLAEAKKAFEAATKVGP